MQRNSDHFKSQLKLQVKSKKKTAHLKDKTFKHIMYNWIPPRKSELTRLNCCIAYDPRLGSFGS